VRVREHDSGDSGAPARPGGFGQAWSAEIRTAVDAYLRHFDQVGIGTEQARATGAAAHKELADWSPALAAELEQIAVGADVPLADVAVLNARTEILATMPSAEGECSVAVRVGPAPVAFQTWDWSADLTPAAAVWHYRTDTGRRVSTFTEPGMLAKIGVNDAGLGVLFNILHHQADGSGPGVPVHAIARRILDEAATVDDAVAIARSAPASASSAITVVTRPPDADADAATLEVTPVGVGVVRRRDDGWLLHTNHVLDPEYADGDDTPPTSTTTARLAHLQSATGRAVDGGSLKAVARDLCGAPAADAPICVFDDERLPRHERRRTMLSVRLDLATAAVEYWPGPPSEVIAS
jgi:isopenicillin-N N-acyltransferase like protein